jgi:hypothetical protein
MSLTSADDFLPGDTTYYFSNELLPGNEFRLVDTKRGPEWRYGRRARKTH